MRTHVAALRVVGIEHVPAAGPVLLAARHVHHLLDGAAIVQRLSRPVHIVVGLDWAASRAQRRWMERACAWADYPVVLRRASLDRAAAYDRSELLRYTRAALRDTTRLLRAGRVVLVFPEGFPAVDPAGSRKRDVDDWLPFEPGFVRMRELAERDGTRVALVPVGFHYRRANGDARWTIVARFGPPLPSRDRDVAAVERAVRALSQP